MKNMTVTKFSGSSIAARVSAQITPQLFGGSDKSAKSFWEFFAVSLNNNTCKAYLSACYRFADWCTHRNIDLIDVEHIVIAAYMQTLNDSLSIQSTKLNLTAIRSLFKWLVVKQVISVNPATDVTSPRYSRRIGKNPIPAADEMKALFDSIQLKSTVAYRDRAIIAVMAYTFARVGAVVSKNGSDYLTEAKLSYFRLQEKGSKYQKVPAHHTAQQFVDEYIAYAGIRDDRKLPLFRAMEVRSNVRIAEMRLSTQRVWKTVKRRCARAGISRDITNHSFRDTGITTFIKNGGTLEMTAKIAGHASTTTTQLYDCRNAEVALDEIERIRY